MKFFLLLLIVACLANKTKIELKPNRSYQNLMDSSQYLNLTIISKNNEPFEVNVYSEKKESLVYKGSHVEFCGHFTFFEIHNLSPRENKIKIYYTSIPHDQFLLDMIISILSIAACVAFFLFDPKSKIVRGLIISLLLMEIYLHGFEYVASHFRPNVLKIK